MEEQNKNLGERRDLEETRRVVAEITANLTRVAYEIDELASAAEPNNETIKNLLIQFSLYEGKLFGSAGLPRKRINEILTTITEQLKTPRAIEEITKRIRGEHIHEQY